MKKYSFVILLIVIHLLFIFLHIYKNALFTQELFTKQRYEKELADLTAQLRAKNNEFLLSKNNEYIQDFAYNTLHLAPIKLEQIRRLS